MKRRLSVTMWVSLVSLVLLAVLILVLKLSLNLPVPELLASISLFLVLIVALLQQIHLIRLERIGLGTAMILERLRLDARLEENIRGFFAMREGDAKRYECVFPVEFIRKPLPLIGTGDYHALQVLTSRLGPDCFDLNPCLRGQKAAIREGCDNLIFICAPDANPITEEIFNEADDMPCWIKIKAPKRCLRIKELNLPEEYLDSPSEKFYEKAAKVYDKNKENSEAMLYEDFINQKTSKDYGIIARITSGSKRYVLIAGLHQQGTWIAAEYLNELLVKKRDKFNSFFFETLDFAVVIWGIFEGPRLRVLDKGICAPYSWQRRAGSWQRVQFPSI
jgi:hypothetical protein